jgi:hypothetical protein
MINKLEDRFYWGKLAENQLFNQEGAWVIPLPAPLTAAIPGSARKGPAG